MDDEYPAVRIAEALESIAKSLEKLADRPELEFSGTPWDGITIREIPHFKK